MLRLWRMEEKNGNRVRHKKEIKNDKKKEVQ